MPKESDGLSIFAAASSHCEKFARNFMRIMFWTSEFVIQSLKLFGGHSGHGCEVLRNYKQIVRHFLICN